MFAALNIPPWGVEGERLVVVMLLQLEERLKIFILSKAEKSFQGAGWWGIVRNLDLHTGRQGKSEDLAFWHFAEIWNGRGKLRQAQGAPPEPTKVKKVVVRGAGRHCAT